MSRVTNVYCLFISWTNISFVFTYSPGDQGPIPGRVIPKTQKSELDASLLNTQPYKVQIKGKLSNSGKEVAPSTTPLWKWEPSGHPRQRSANLYIYWPNASSVRQWSGRTGFNPRLSQKWYFIPLSLTLSIIRIKGKVEQSREWSRALSYTSVW